MWFHKLFGFNEAEGIARSPTTQIPFNPDLNYLIQSKFDLTEDARSGHQILRSKANGRAFHIGKYTNLSLGYLRCKGQSFLSERFPSENSVMYEHIAVQDLIELHAKCDGAIFQAASQFNCLEFANPRAVPELGIEIYASDRTQGPACALACAAGTLYRNYFAPVTVSKDGSVQYGQSTHNQINNLDELESVIDGESFWTVTNGYTFSTDEQLERLGKVLASCNRKVLRDVIKVGVQENVGVTFASRNELSLPTQQCTTTDSIVTQVYCSALSCGYSGVSITLWKPFARLVLEAAYEATLWAAVVAAPVRASSRREIFLTFLGGGVFRNDIAWILEAMVRAIVVLQRAGADMDIKICHYRVVDESVCNRFQQLYEELSLIDDI